MFRATVSAMASLIHKKANIIPLYSMKFSYERSIWKIRFSTQFFQNGMFSA